MPGWSKNWEEFADPVIWRGSEVVGGGIGEVVTRYRVTAGTLVIDLGARRPVLSSAPRGGGLTRARYILNHQVDANPLMPRGMAAGRHWGDPSRDLGKVARRLGVESRCVGLMTAVPMTHLVVLGMRRATLRVECFVTVGVSNAVRVGERPHPRTPHPAAVGTINIVLVTNARLSAAALVGLVQVVTEAKAAALLDMKVTSHTGRAATGTGTDAVVIATGTGPRLRYSGTHTEIGAMSGRLVEQAVTRGLRRAHSKTTTPGVSGSVRRKKP